MKIEVLVIDENAIVVKGLRSAIESRNISNAVEEERRSCIMATLAEEKFVETAMAEIIYNINQSSEHGFRETSVSGHGCRASAFRAYGNDKCNLMEEIIKYQILPILRERGYRCEVIRGHFASKEQYFTVKVFW